MRWALFNLVMMMFWLGLGIGLFFFPEVFGWEEGGGANRNLFGTGALLLALWNLVRCWSIYAARADQRARWEMEERRPRRSLEPEQEKPVVNPEFDFDGEEPRYRKGPPSANGNAAS